MIRFQKQIILTSAVAACLAMSGCQSAGAKKVSVVTPLAPKSKALDAKAATKSQKKQWEQATALSNVKTVMQKQVNNAIVAGVGDLEAQNLRETMINDPEDPQVRLKLAEHYESKGFVEVAVEIYRLAGERFPDCELVQIRLAQILRKNERSAEAAESLGAFLDKSKSQNADLYSWLGIVLDDIGSLEDAEKAYQYAIYLEPKKDAHYNNHGYNLYLQGKAPEAEIEIRRALQLNSSSPIARNNLAIVTQNREEALAQFKAGSDMATAYNNRAATLIEQGDLEEARAELEKAIGYRKDLPQVWSNLRLVGELDGKGVRLTLAAHQEPKPILKRLASQLKRAFIGEPKTAGLGAKGTNSLGAAVAEAAQDLRYYRVALQRRAGLAARN